MRTSILRFLVIVVLAAWCAPASGGDAVADARAQVAAGRPKRALVLLDAHLASFPDDAAALVWRGAARLKAAQEDAAADGPAALPRLKAEWARSLADLDRALTLDPKSAAGHFWRGYGYAVDGDDRRATAEYDEAIALDPIVADAWSERGAAKERRNDLRGARADYLAALARDPAHAHARIRLPSVERRLGVPPTPLPAPGAASPPTPTPPDGARPPPAPTQPAPGTGSSAGGTLPSPPPPATASASSRPASLEAEAQESLDTFSRAVLFVAGKDPAEPALYRAIYEGLDGEYVEIELVREPDGFLNVGGATAVLLGRERAVVDALIGTYRRP